MNSILNKFTWLEGMDYDRARTLMFLHSPYFLYPYYIDGKNFFKTDDFNQYRLHVRIENNIIILVNSIG